MPAGRTGAAALLLKANSQLRGERVPIVTKEEDELAVYLSGLQTKTHQVRSASFEDHGDISISSGKDDRFGGSGRQAASPALPANKFLKKKKPVETQESREEDDHVAEDRGIVIAGRRTENVSKGQGLTKKVKDAQQAGTPFRRHTSRDSDSESDFGRRPTSADTSVGRDGRKFLKGRVKVNDEDSRPKTRSPSPQIAQRGGEEKNKQRRSSKARGEIVRTLGNVCLSSEEESLADFIHGLSVSEASSKRPQNLVAKKQQKWRKTKTRQSPSPLQGSRSPSPFKRSPSPVGKLSRSLSQDSDLLDSMATEVVEDRRGRAGSISSEDNLNINLMDVASLLPASPSPRSGRRKSPGRSKRSSKDPFKASSTDLVSPGSHKRRDQASKKTKKKSSLKKSDSKSSLFDNLGIHMVDELLDVGGGVKGIDLTDQSEILTEESDNNKRKLLKREESESEIITELGGGDSRKVPARRSLSPEKSVTISERLGVDSSIRRKPRSPSLSNEETDTETSQAYTDDTFETISKSHSLSQSSPRRRKKSRSKASHSERQVVLEQRHTQVTTADATGLPHHWESLQAGLAVSGPYGLHYVDPAPVATHVISADALEAVTAYSPSMLALQDMMRAQLDLVRNFASLQARMHQACVQGLREDYHYTTLEGTKKYIEEHRKPRMTFQEALRLVDLEEGVAV